MSSDVRGHHRALRGAAALLVVLLGAACSSGGGGNPGDAGAPDDRARVTIRHRYGATSLTDIPQRVVTVGLTDHDAVLALGVKPVGVTDWFGNQPSATWPWARAALGDAKPEIVGDPTAINFERVAALRPDVILALYAGLSKADFETLSQIAPTVAQPEEYVDYGIPWQEQTLTVGRALGKAGVARELVDDVEDRFARVRAEHPEFDDASGLVATPAPGLVSVYAPEDVRGRFLAALGFVQPPEIADLAGDEFSADLSFERLDLLDVDALVWIVNDVETDRARMEQETLYTNLPVHAEQREVFVENTSELGGATSFVSILSLPILLDQLVPQLAAAIDGDPATT